MNNSCNNPKNICFMYINDDENNVLNQQNDRPQEKFTTGVGQALNDGSGGVGCTDRQQKPPP